MFKNSVVICYSTPNYETLTRVFKNSLHNIGVKNDRVLHKFDIPDNNLMKNTGFRTNLFLHCIINKIKFIVDKLKENREKYEYYICSDCDIWFLPNRKHLWDELENFIQNSDYDIYFMREFNRDIINGGFYIIKSRNIQLMIDFMENIYNVLVNTPKDQLPYYFEQDIINNNLYKIKSTFIPNEYVIWGDTIYDCNKSLFHHAVCCNDTDDKITQIKKIKEIFNLPFIDTEIPRDFDINVYRILNNLHNLDDDAIINDWINYGKVEGKQYKVQDIEFDYLAYKFLNGFNDWTDSELMWHWLNHGRYEGRCCTLPFDFDYNAYRNLNGFNNWTDSEVKWHWLNHGRNENRLYKY